MPLYILLLIASAPVFAMIGTAGDALGRDAGVAALIALAIILATLVARLVAEAVHTIRGIFGAARCPGPTASDTLPGARSFEMAKSKSAHS